MLAIVVEVIVGVTTSRRHNDGDNGVMPVTMMIMQCPKMEIERAKMIMAISCHYMIAL